MVRQSDIASGEASAQSGKRAWIGIRLRIDQGNLLSALYHVEPTLPQTFDLSLYIL